MLHKKYNMNQNYSNDLHRGISSLVFVKNIKKKKEKSHVYIMGERKTNYKVNVIKSKRKQLANKNVILNKYRYGESMWDSFLPQSTLAFKEQ
jgi:hypothetical protein